MNTTTIQTTPEEFSSDLISKRPTDEEVNQIRAIDGSQWGLLSLIGESDARFWHFTNPGYFIKNAQFWVDYHGKEIIGEKEYIEQIESHQIYQIETDDEVSIHQDGKLFYPYHIDEMIAENKKLIKNTKQRIRRLEQKVSYKQQEIDNATKYVAIFNAVKGDAN